MKTKLLFGLAATSAASLFWACGSGDILKTSQDDDLVAMAYTGDGETEVVALRGMVDTAIEQYCQGDENCVKSAQPGGAVVPQAQSSSSLGYTPIDKNGTLSSPSQNNNNTNPTNPSDIPNIVVNPSSSSNSGSQPSSGPSNPTTPASSNSTPVITSGGSTTGGEPWGTCQAAGVKNNAVTKGSNVTWTITPKKVGPIADVTVLGTLTYDWTFEGGSPATVSSGTTKNAATQYANSGTFMTTVKMTIGSGESQVVQCPTLEVTGAAVTGCTCKAAKTAADISEGVSWTVSGCVSEDQNFTYTWSEPFQSVTTAVLSGSVAAKGLYKPTVRVKNGDNGLMDVTCDEIAVSDKNNPDYIIKAVQGDGAIKLPAGKTSVSLEVDPYNKTVFCTIAREDSPTGAVNGTVNGVKLAGADYVAVQNVPNLTKGTMINFELDVPATCGVQ